MRQKLTFMALVLFSVLASATDLKINFRVAQQILNDSKIMASADSKIKSILPELEMKFAAIQVDASATKYSAIITYTDTAKDTFFNPAFGKCSVLIRGKVVNNASITVDSLSEDNCGE